MFTMSPLFFAKAATAVYLNQLSLLPKSVWSLRRMMSAASRSIRVRRSSDSTELDIGFVGNALDTAALATFVGAGSGFVTKFYDQTANGIDLVQATAAKQPRIVNAGTYAGALVFDGVDDAMGVVGYALSLPQAAIYGKAKQSTTGTKIVVESSTNFNNNPFTIAFYVESSTYAMGSNNGSTATQKVNYFPLALTAALTQFSLLYDRVQTGLNETKAWSAGTQKTATTTIYTAEQSGSFGSNDLYVGARAGTSLFTDMSLETLVIYNGDSQALRDSIEAVVA